VLDRAEKREKPAFVGRLGLCEQAFRETAPADRTAPAIPFFFSIFSLRCGTHAGKLFSGGGL
jgi:hypothetical protein